MLLKTKRIFVQDKDESFKERTELAGALRSAPGLCAGASPPARQAQSGKPRSPQLVEIQPQTYPARQIGCPPHPTARPAQPHERRLRDGLESCRLADKGLSFRLCGLWDRVQSQFTQPNKEAVEASCNRHRSTVVIPSR